MYLFTDQKSNAVIYLMTKVILFYIYTNIMNNIFLGKRIAITLNYERLTADNYKKDVPADTPLIVIFKPLPFVSSHNTVSILRRLPDEEDVAGMSTKH